MSVAVASIDVMAIVLGGLLSRPLGREMWIMGAVVALWVNVCFAVLVGGHLAIECAADWWMRRRHR